MTESRQRDSRFPSAGRIGRNLVIDELHRVRKDIGKAHGFDVRRIAATIRQHEDENPKGIIRESPKRTTRQKKAF